MRQIALDTETTGLRYYEGHRIVEIGCIEIIDRKITDKKFHTYINPLRQIDPEARKITGISDDFLTSQPLFQDVVNNFLDFLENAEEIIIHNANFDVNFINNELRISNSRLKDIKSQFQIFDTLVLARKLHPGKKNNLNALCERYNIENNDRDLHGALIDAELLAKVYIEMTSKQTTTLFKKPYTTSNSLIKQKKFETIKASKQELKEHIEYIANLREGLPNNQNE